MYTKISENIRYVIILNCVDIKFVWFYRIIFSHFEIVDNKVQKS